MPPQKRSKLGDLKPIRPSSAKLLAPLALSSLLASSATQATIIYTPLDLSVNMPAQPTANNVDNTDNTDVNVLGNAVNDIKLEARHERGNTQAAIFRKFIIRDTTDATGKITLNFFGASRGSGYYFTNFAQGANIAGANQRGGASLLQHIASGTNNAQHYGNFWPDPIEAGAIRTGYVGFTAVPTGSQVVNGWIKVQVKLIDEGNPNIPDYFKLLGIAYEDGGLAIKAGQTVIPEASHTATGLGLLALGATAILKRRKARKVKKACK